MSLFSSQKEIVKTCLSQGQQWSVELLPSTRSRIFQFTFTYFLKALAVSSESTAIMWLASQIRTRGRPSHSLSLPAWSDAGVGDVDEIWLPCVSALFCARRLVNPPLFADVSLIENVVVVGDRFDPGRWGKHRTTPRRLPFTVSLSVAHCYCCVW